MIKLVRVGKAFPNSLFVAVGLLLCLSAHGALAAQRKPASTTDCASASNKNKPPCIVENPTGQITVFWPKLRMGNAFGRVVDSKIEVWIDKTLIGQVNGDAPLTVNLPNGPHKLELKPYDDYLENIRPTRETQITVSAQKPLYFQIVHQGFVVIASELDASTAQAVLSGNEPPKEERTAPASQAAASDKEPKNKPNAYPSLAALAGDDTKMPSGAGTIYLYWPKPSIGLSFLDRFNTDVPVFLDEKRIGAITNGDYLVLKVSSGEHVLGLDVGLPNGRLLKQDFILGAGSTSYFHVEHQDAFRMFEDLPEEAVDNVKGLRQREAIVR